MEQENTLGVKVSQTPPKRGVARASSKPCDDVWDRGVQRAFFRLQTGLGPVWRGGNFNTKPL